MNNRDVFISHSIILANIFCRTRGLDLCGLTIEPSNYCAGRSSLIARSERPPTKFNIYNSPMFSEGIYAFHIWGITYYRKVVMRGFSRDFKSPLDAIISTFCAQKKKKRLSLIAENLRNYR